MTNGGPDLPQFDDGKAPDALRTIGEVAKALKIRQHVLRYWEEQFPALKPVKRSGGRGRWLGMVSVVKWDTGAAPLPRGYRKIGFQANRPFQVVSRGRATGARQTARGFRAGGWRVRNQVNSRSTWSFTWGGPVPVMNHLANTVAGVGDPNFYYGATGTVAQNVYRIEVTPTGTGTGDIVDNVQTLDCDITAGRVSGTCEQWYPAGTPMTMTYTVPIGSVFEAWTGACKDVDANSPCNLGSPAGGQTIKLGGLFVKTA